MRKKRYVLCMKIDAQFAGAGTKAVQAVEFLEGKSPVLPEMTSRTRCGVIAERVLL